MTSRTPDRRQYEEIARMVRERDIEGLVQLLMVGADGRAADAAARIQDGLHPLRRALIQIVNVLGPDSIADCPENRCDGCKEEAAEALRIAKLALLQEGTGRE